MDALASMFGSIYGPAHKDIAVEIMGLHLLEETAEVARAIRLLSASATLGPSRYLHLLENEIADVLSWLVSVFHKVNYHVSNRGREFASWGNRFEIGSVSLFSILLWETYGSTRDGIRCPDCGGRPCDEILPYANSEVRKQFAENGRSRSRSIIAIDGPVGSGKSTVAKRVADLLGYVFLDSGAMYRALTWKALRSNTSLRSAEGLEALARETHIDVESVDRGIRVRVDGTDVTDSIRSADVALATSEVAMHPEVRTVLVEEQRRAGRAGGVVMEGRDIGSIVFPDAEVKVFLTASPEVRAKRRWLEHQQKGDGISLERTVEEVRERDRRDLERKVSPLRRSPDAVYVDSTAMDAEEVARLIVLLARERQKDLSATTAQPPSHS